MYKEKTENICQRLNLFAILIYKSLPSLQGL